jgi:tetratricopeptide (TPR) repeat protein
MELKSKGVWLGCGIPAVVTGVLVLLLGLYIVGGYGMARGIIRGYEDGNCQPAVQLGQYLERFYPQAIAPFAEQALLNSEECLLYTQASVHEDAGEYELACQAYEAYVKAYPDGKFAEQAAENAAQNLLMWGENLFEDGQTQKAIQAFERLLEIYPESEAAETATQALPEAYLAWAREAWQVGNYPEAIQRMLFLHEQHPQSPEGIKTETLLPEIYLEWANELWQEKDYEEAIAKLQHVKGAYPTSGYLNTANEVLSEIYLEWGQELHEEKDYGNAVEKLNMAARLVSASNKDLANEIQECLCSAHKDWAVALLTLKNFSGAISHYKTAGTHASTSAEKSNISEAVASTYLDWAQDLIRRNSFHEALEKIELARKASKVTVIEARSNQTYDDTVQAFSKSSGAQAKKEMETVVPLICSGKTVSLPIFALNPDEKKFFSAINLPGELQAKTPETLHYVVCRSVSERKIQTCGPYTSSSQPWIRLYIERYVIDWKVTVFDVLTGKVLAQNTFTGASPRLCRYTEHTSTKKLTGDSPDIKVLHDWLSKLRLP